MIGLILIIVVFLIIYVFGIKLGIDYIVTELRALNRISQEEAEYMLSWQYLIDKLREA
jgi:hypothetical protein